MASDPGKPGFAGQLTRPVFAGKLTLRTTNASGQRYFLSYTAKTGQVLPTLSATRAAAPAAVWTAYEAGSGAVVLVSDTGLYVCVQEGNYVAVLLPDPGEAAAVTLQPAGDSGQIQIAWTDFAGQARTAYYQLGTGLPATLTFLATGGPGTLSTLGQSVTTPGLAAIRRAKSAAGCDLTSVNLAGADLSGIDCTQARLDNAIMADATVAGAVLTGASLTGVDLTGVIWGDDIRAASADFSDSIGIGITVPSTDPPAKRATFDGATFTGADWSGADLTGASLHNAFVTGANFSGATLTGGYLYAIQAGKSNDGTAPGADFSYACMPDVNLQNSNLNGADLSDAQIYLLNVGASLLNADLTETDFSRADLSGASFGGHDTSIAGTRFDGAVLFTATFDGAALVLSATGTPVTFTGAWLENATFKNTLFSGVRMSGARVAVPAGPAGAGVPLFTITADADSYLAALDQNQLPGAFTGAGGLFAQAGYSLAQTACVQVVRAGQCWTLTQPPVRATPGVEEVAFAVLLAGAALDVYASGISLVEQGNGTVTFATSYTVGLTALPPASLSAGTVCPNRATKAANHALGLSWQQMMTAPRLSLAILTSGSAGMP
ncbi:MAG TPA: pentapeptide repeat-containing protein [Streptosporangiaceae bacterium]|nr:pentapeptide repeat-containing protein [Streptosporangiaceae bacterium]